MRVGSLWSLNSKNHWPFNFNVEVEGVNDEVVNISRDKIQEREFLPVA
jgi:hypothetical protein